MFALFWAFMSIHCKVEGVPALKFLACESQSSNSNSSDHCAQKGCCSFEGAVYKSECAKLVAPPQNLVPSILLSLLQDMPKAENAPPILTESPLEFRQSWQFVSRTALPIRAPSLLA